MIHIRCDDDDGRAAVVLFCSVPRRIPSPALLRLRNCGAEGEARRCLSIYVTKVD